MRTLEFESRLLEDGHLYCPEEVLQQVVHSEKVIVRVILEFGEKQPEKTLDVTEKQIQAIMKRQGVGRETVIHALNTAGSFALDEEFEREVLEVQKKSKEEADVTEEEIQQVMKMQGRSREDVLALLGAAGAFSDDEDYEERMRQIRERGNRWRTTEWS